MTQCGLWVTLMSLAGLCGCQVDEVGRRRGISPLATRNVRGYLEHVVRDRNRRQTSKVGGGKTRFEETIFEENIKLEMDGHAYHPNLLDFTAGILLGLQQHHFRDLFNERERKSGGEGPVTEFEFEGQLFKKKKFPGTFFARRFRSLEPRPFLSSLETTTTNYGFTWQYVSAKSPTSLQFNHTDVRLDPLSDFEDKGRQQNTLIRFETGYKFSEHNSVSLIWEHRAVKEEPFEFNYNSNELSLSHVGVFGDIRQHRLDSELNIFSQKGTFSIERVRWRETMRLQHRENLRSWLQFEFLDRTQGSLVGVAPVQEQSYSTSGTIEHKLYESLVSQLLGFAMTQEFKSGLTIDRFGGQITLDYRKTNPWGVLLANYRVRAQRENRQGAADRMEVLDEIHTFRDPAPTTLNNSNVDTSSIFITAEDRITTYRITRDYTVDVVGDRTELRRVATGRIPDGETVLIDYVFHLGGSFVLDTVNHEVRIRQNFDSGLSPYYRLMKQDQTITPARAIGAIAEDITGHLVGLEFQRGSLRLMAEFEDYDSTISPFDTVRLTADYTRRFKSGAVGTLKTRWSRINQQAPNPREIRFATIEGRYRHPITDHFMVEGVCFFRNERDSVSGRDEGVDVDLSLEWTIRQTEIRLTYDYGKFDDDFARNDHTALYLQVRRRF